MSDRNFKCVECGATCEAGCEHGLGAYRPLAYFVAKALEEHPEKSSRAIAEELGVAPDTVDRARKQLPDCQAVGSRIGRDGKTRKMPRQTRRATPEETKAAGFRPAGGSRVVIETGEVVGRIEAIKIENVAAAVQDKDAIICELEAEVRTLRYELGLRPSMDDLRRIDSVARHVQRITTDIDTYNLFRRCLHPDSRNSVSNEILHQAWLAFRNLEQLTYDKKKIAPPLPADLGELFRKREAAEARRRSKV